MSFDDVGKGFTQQYYQIFSNNKADLRSIYRSSTLMTWVGEQIQGVDAILQKFSALSFNQSRINAELIDCHPSLSGGVLVVVNGEVLLQNEQHPLKFNDVFHLAIDESNGQWFVSNQLFRIVGGGGSPGS